LNPSLAQAAHDAGESLELARQGAIMAHQAQDALSMSLSTEVADRRRKHAQEIASQALKSANEAASLVKKKKSSDKDYIPTQEKLRRAQARLGAANALVQTLSKPKLPVSSPPSSGLPATPLYPQPQSFPT